MTQACSTDRRQTAAAKAQAAGRAPKFEGTSEIQEIKVLGDWAFMWSRLTVVATPPDGAAPVRRAGHANLLAPLA